MGRLKTFRKYILWIVGFYIFSMLITYIAFNATYKNINSVTQVPENVNIVLAQATKVNGRIYGEVTSTEENNLNGKYLRVRIFTGNYNFAGTRYIKIENVEQNIPKKFEVNFKVENIKYYAIDLIDEQEQSEEHIAKIQDLYKNVFSLEKLKTVAIIFLVIKLIF